MISKRSMATNWKFNHIGVVVRDLEKADNYFQSLEIVDEVSAVLIMEGKKARADEKIIRIGDLHYEYCQSIRGATVQQEFLDSIGEGVNHICFNVDNYEDAYHKLVEEKGVRFVFGKKPPLSPESTMGYFDTREGQNIIIQLVQQPPDFGSKFIQWRKIKGSISTNWKLSHIGIVVRDLGKAGNYFQSLDVVNEVRPGLISEGKKAKLIGKFIRIGNLDIEYWQPIRGETVQQEFLDSVGEGVNHICFNVDNYEEAYNKLVAEKGVRLVFRHQKPPKGIVGYFDTREGQNILLELAQGMSDNSKIS